MNYMKIIILLRPNSTAHLQHRCCIIFLSSAMWSSRPTTITPADSVSRDNSLYGEQWFTQYCHRSLPVWSWIRTANKLKQRACSLILNLAIFLCPRQLRKSFQVAYFSVVQISNSIFLPSKWVIQYGELGRMMRQCQCLPVTSVWLFLHATCSLLQIFPIWISWVNIWGRVSFECCNVETIPLILKNLKLCIPLFWSIK
jgi:hypothetical protein